MYVFWDGWIYGHVLPDEAQKYEETGQYGECYKHSTLLQPCPHK